MAKISQVAQVKVSIVNNAINKKKTHSKKQSGNIQVCGHCGGNGKDLMNVFNHGICGVCHGKGKVRV